LIFSWCGFETLADALGLHSSNNFGLRRRLSKGSLRVGFCRPTAKGSSCTLPVGSKHTSIFHQLDFPLFY
jgi:hypothetical protein